MKRLRWLTFRRNRPASSKHRRVVKKRATGLLLGISAVVSLLLISIGVARCEKPKFDFTKGKVIEKPAHDIVRKAVQAKFVQQPNAQPQPAAAEGKKALDPTKRLVIEKPTHDLVEQSGSTAEPPHTTVPENPTVAPGKVRWHASFAAARAAWAKAFISATLPR